MIPLHLQAYLPDFLFQLYIIVYYTVSYISAIRDELRVAGASSRLLLRAMGALSQESPAARRGTRSKGGLSSTTGERSEEFRRNTRIKELNESYLLIQCNTAVTALWTVVLFHLIQYYCIFRFIHRR